MSKIRHHSYIVVILLIAFLLRVRTLAIHPLWFDEAMEYWVATTPLTEILPIVKDALQDPPLFSILLHFWMRLGIDEFTLRLLSAFLSILAIPLMVVWGSRTYRYQAGLVGAILLAIAPPHIRFAQEVGQYALLITTLLLNLTALSFALRTNQPKYWVLWLLSGLISSYNYYGSLLIIMTTMAITLTLHIWQQKWPSVKRQIAVWGLFCLANLPLWLIWMPAQLFRGPSRNALQITWEPPLTELYRLYTKTKFLFAYQLTGYIAPPENLLWLKTIAFVLILTALLMGIVSSGKKTNLILWLLGCWLTYALVGRLGAYPYAGTRHSLILFPLLILIMSIGIHRIWHTSQQLGMTFLASMVVVALIAIPEPAEDIRSVVNDWLAHEQSELPTYVYYGAVPAFRYQLQLKQEPAQNIPATWYRTCWANEPSPYCTQDNIYYGRWLRNLTPMEQLNDILSVLGENQDQFWLIFSHTADEDKQNLLDVFANHYTITYTIKHEGASAYLWQKLSQPLP